MNLQSYFKVTDRTLRRWKADGADLECAESLCGYLRNLMRPSPSVEARIYSPTFEKDVEAILNLQHEELDCYAFIKEVAGDPNFKPFFDLAELPDGPCYEPSAFSERVLEHMTMACTGLGIMVRLLEHDPALEAHYGDARAAFAEGGSPVDDRDLLTLLITAERLLSAQAHRLQGCYRNIVEAIGR